MSSGDQRVACCVCGDDTYALKRMSPLGNGYACPADARGFTDDDMLGARQAIPKAGKSRPADQTREASVIPLYQKAEAEVFNLLVAHKGTGVPPNRWVMMGGTGGNADGGVGIGDGKVLTTDVAVDLDVCSWTAIYLYELLAEDSRPLSWVAPGTAKLRSMADTLLANQIGSPTLRTGITSLIGTLTATSLNYGGLAYTTNMGGFIVGSAGLHDEGPWERTSGVPNGFTATDKANCYSGTTAVAGVALLRAYQFLGDKKYRDGYLRVATWLHRALYGELVATGYIDINSAPLHVGIWPTYSLHSTASGGYYTNDFSPEGIIGLEFLVLLKAQEGDIQIGDATAVDTFTTQPPLRLISDVIATVGAVWANGIVAQSPQEYADGTAPQTLRSGFGATPYEFLRVGTSGLAFHPRWEFQHGDNQQPVYSVFGMTYAYAMRGWYAAFGFDSTLETMWNFFMSTVTGSDYTTPDGTPKVIARQTAMGTYAPGEVGLAQATCVENFETYERVNFLCDDCAMGLDWGTVGVLADLWVAQNPAGFALAKQAMSEFQRARETIPHDEEFYRPVVLRYTGVDLQPFPLVVTTHPSGTGNSVPEPEKYNLATDAELIGNYHARALDALGAAMAGLAYRRQPKIYATRDRP